jgi:hypothetical protein
MDVGVYYRDNVSATWTLYNAGLPNMPLSDLEISPANPTKLVAASYGRGVWMVDVVGALPPAAPVSNFSVSAAAKCVGSPVLFSDQSTNTPTGWNWSSSPSAGVVITSATSQNPNFTFPSAGNYTVTLVASNATGPGNTINQVVTVTGLPTVVISNSVQSVCLGSQVAFTASGATTYNWSNGGGSATTASYTPLATTVYTVTGTSSGCSASKTATVTSLPLPVINATPNNSVVCQGQSVVLNATGASTYSWMPGNVNGASVTFSPAATTNYTVNGTGANGCVNTTNVSVNVSVCTGLNLVSNNTGFSLYPNPTNGILLLKMNTNQTTSVLVEVMDMAGKVILKNEFNFSDKGNATEINLEKFANGVYFIKLVTSDKATQTIRVVKE